MNGDVIPNLTTAAAAAVVQQLQARAEEEATVRPENIADDRSGQLIGISIAFAVMTTILVALRFYAKRFQSEGVFADEVYLVLAWGVNLGMCALGIVMTQVGGVGRHVAFLEETNRAAFVGWAQCIFAFELVYFTSVALPKLAILALYLRVFNWRGGMRALAWVVATLVALTSASLVVAACFQCRPIAFWWDKTIAGGVCFDVQAFFHAQAIPGFVLDLVIMAMPLETIWHLNLPTYKRLALVGVFLIASFGIVASIIRATVFFGTAAFGDRTWASVDLVGWSIIETSVYIITGCLPHLKPLISHYTPAWLKRAVNASLSSLPTKLGSSRGGQYGTRSGYGRGTRLRDQKSQPGGHDQHSPDEDDSIELTGGQPATPKGALSMTSSTTMDRHSPTRGHVWPHNQLADAENGLSPTVNIDIRSSSLEGYQEGGPNNNNNNRVGKRDSPPQTAGQITVTREIKMTRE